MGNPYLDQQRVRAALRALELRPSHGMGQNFLIDPQPLAQIVSAAELQPSDTVLEIGPGLGVLTWELLQRAGRVVAVELDKRLAARLQTEFANAPQLHVIQRDILRISPAEALTVAAAAPPYKVVANLPYAITSPVLRHLLEATQPPVVVVVLVQWEVATRIAARPGDMSVLAHAVQVYAEPEIIARVGAACFTPVPAVDSAVLRLRLRPHPALDGVAAPALLRLIKAGFLQARKQLANALPGGMAALGAPLDKAGASAALAAAGIAPERRAETLTLEEWVRLYRALGK